MGFLVCSQSGVRLLSASCASPMERIVEMIPQALEGLRALGDDEEERSGGKPRVQAVYRE